VSCGAAIVLVFVGCLFASKKGLAGDEAEGVGFVYNAPPGCPDEAQFVRLVREKTTRFLPGPVRAGQRAFRVSIRGDHPSRGELVIQGGAVPEARRAYEGDSCAEIAAALALATALAVDPHALAAPAVSSVPLDPLPTPSAPVLPAPPLGSASAPSAPFAAPAAPAPVARTNPTPGRRAWSFGLGLLGHTATGVAPNPLWAGGLTMQLLDQPVHPQLVTRLDLEYGAAASTPVNGGTLEFSRWLARLAVCPFTRGFGVADAMICGHLAVGLLTARTEGIPKATQDTGYWGSAGASLVLRLALPGKLFLDVSGGIDAPFRRDRFTVQPAQELHHVPAAGGLASVAVVKSL